MSANKSLILILIFCLASLSTAHRWVKFVKPGLLDPVVLRPFMFTRQITGKSPIMIPSKQVRNVTGTIINQEYKIQMVQTKQQMLPPEIFGKTTIYAYGGNTETGYYAGFPGPAIVATKDRQTKVTWTNKIIGPHILPVDYNYPFESNTAYKDQVPTVTHGHGLATASGSDGQPEAYWTSSGFKSAIYESQQFTTPNSAVFYYPNQQQAGNHWYHDHAIGITRLNVYAGLAGLYKIIDPNSKKQTDIINKYGITVREDQTKFLIVTDKSFKNNGQLYYDGVVTNPNFSTWMPQFFGNTMQVNGVVWPKMTLKKDKHRFVLLNACQGRYLNLWFQNNGQKIPFDMIRIDGGFYSSPVTVTEFLATVSARIQFILDLTNIQGQVIMKNDAGAPYPMGNPANYDPEFTGQIMKIIVSTVPPSPIIINSGVLSQSATTISTTTTTSTVAPEPYPKWAEGEKVFTTLFEVTNENGDVDGAFIDGLSMKTSMTCPNSTYTAGKTYDFYYINLTPDTHPMHVHLIQFQKVKQYPFDVTGYSNQYFAINGGKPNRTGFATAPISLDPEAYRIGPDELATDRQKVFRDTVDAQTGYVTVIRIKFAKYDGSNFNSFDMRGQRYVQHCHILEHQDNDMMKYFCLK